MSVGLFGEPLIEWFLLSVLFTGMIALIIVEIIKLKVYIQLVEEFKIHNQILSGLRAKISELARGVIEINTINVKGRKEDLL